MLYFIFLPSHITAWLIIPPPHLASACACNTLLTVPLELLCINLYHVTPFCFKWLRSRVQCVLRRMIFRLMDIVLHAWKRYCNVSRIPPNSTVCLEEAYFMDMLLSKGLVRLEQRQEQQKYCKLSPDCTSLLRITNTLLQTSCSQSHASEISDGKAIIPRKIRWRILKIYCAVSIKMYATEKKEFLQEYKSEK